MIPWSESLLNQSWSDMRPWGEFRCYCGNSKCIYNRLNNPPRKRKKQDERKQPRQ